MRLHNCTLETLAPVGVEIKRLASYLFCLGLTLVPLFLWWLLQSSEIRNTSLWNKGTYQRLPVIIFLSEKGATAMSRTKHDECKISLFVRIQFVSVTTTRMRTATTTAGWLKQADSRSTLSHRGPRTPKRQQGLQSTSPSDYQGAQVHNDGDGNDDMLRLPSLSGLFSQYNRPQKSYESTLNDNQKLQDHLHPPCTKSRSIRWLSVKAERPLPSCNATTVTWQCNARPPLPDI